MFPDARSLSRFRTHGSNVGAINSQYQRYDDTLYRSTNSSIWTTTQGLYAVTVSFYVIILRPSKHTGPSHHSSS